MPTHRFELPASAPTPPDGWFDEGKLSEYVDGSWIRKPDLGRLDTTMTIQAVLNMLMPFKDLLGGQILPGWHMMAVPDFLRPHVQSANDPAPAFGEAPEFSECVFHGGWCWYRACL